MLLYFFTVMHSINKIFFIGESLLVKAIAKTTGSSDKQIKAKLDKQGDLGLVAESSRSSQRTLFQPKPLEIPGVFKCLKDIAQITGNKSQDLKISKIQTMLTASKQSEARYAMQHIY